MSTYVHLMCMDHNPPLAAQDESGQHLYDLPTIWRDVADREVLVRLWEEGETDWGYFRVNTVRFLAAHRTCTIGACDEYGDWHTPPEREAARAGEGEAS